MQLCVNGETKDVSAQTLAEAVANLGYTGKQFAVAVDGAFVPRHQHESFALAGGERLEILAPMQGG